jgi:hypothetical protein
MKFKDWTWKDWLDILAVSFLGFYVFFVMVETAS